MKRERLKPSDRVVVIRGNRAEQIKPGDHARVLKVGDPRMDRMYVPIELQFITGRAGGMIYTLTASHVNRLTDLFITLADATGKTIQISIIR